MRNELQRHKRSDKVKWVLTGIMFFLAFVMIAGLFLQVFGTGKTKPSEWFKKQDSEQTQQLPTEGGENGTAYTRVKSMAAKFSLNEETDGTGIMPLSNSEITESELQAITGTTTATILSSTNLALWQSVLTVNNNITNETLNNFIFYRDRGGLVPVMTTRLLFQRRNVFESLSSFSLDKVFEYKNGNGAVTIRLKDDYYYMEFGQGETPSACNVNSIVLTYSYIDTRVPVPLPDDPVKEGYTFVGWYYDSEFSIPYNGGAIYEDTNLYAKFEINKFTVTFNSDGGSSVANQTVDWNTAAMLPTPTKEKHAFKGWFLPNGTQYTNQPIKENTTLTAHWERNVFTVTFNTDGGSAVESQDVNLNAAVTLPTTTRTGYIFKGWYLSDGTEYTNQPVTDDTTLTAYWELQTFTVTFYVDGEVYVMKTVEYGHGLAKVAETANLKMLSVRMESGVPTFDDNGAVIVTENCSVEAQEMSDTDKVINTVKQNKWAIIGGVAGGVALIAVIAAVCGGKRKRKR